jgi:predicted dinucleotide-binding enzyme
MRIGILGTGNVARALAPAWSAAGHDVLLGSRSPGDIPGLAVAGLTEAARHGEVVVNATPGTVSLEVLGAIGERALAGKVLIDIGIGFTHGMADLAHPGISLGEHIQRLLPQTPVVKTLCTVTASVMAGPGQLQGPSTVFLSGDDPAAKRTTAALLGDLGWPEPSRMDLGGITTARGQEHFALLFFGIAGALGTHEFNVAVVPVRPR